jgi:hypothetical protein
MTKLKLKPKEEENEERKSNKEESSLSFILSNLEIDKFKLDEEATKQVDLLDKISKILPKARDATLKAKNKLEIAEFEISQQMRKNPKEYGLSKDTDTVIFKAVKTTKEYKKAFSQYAFCKEKEDEYQLLHENVKQRGFMIKLLMELWLNNYYSNPADYVTKRKKKKSIDLEED